MAGSEESIYPDVIESAGAKTGKAHVIKSHHNVGGLPREMKLKLLEPLRELFKDEVRKLGLALDLPSEMVSRHPFPGPGLGVRILGEIHKSHADLLRRADAIFIEELRRHDLYDKVSQAFAVFLPVRSVGVMGDGRRDDHVIALRAVETIDFMTARWARLPYGFLDRVAHRIINEVRGISRVVYAGKTDRIAAIHRQDHAGDVRSLVACQKQCRGGDLARQTPAVDRNPGQSADAGRRDGVLLRCRDEAGPDRAGGDCVHANIAVGIVQRGRLGHLVHSGFCGAIDAMVLPADHAGC